MNTENNLTHEYFQDTLNLLRKIRNNESSWAEMNKLRENFGLPPMSIDALRRNFFMLSRFDENNWISAPKENMVPTGSESIATDYVKGTTTSDKFISILPEFISDPKKLLEAHGFNPDEFELISAKNSKWGQSTENGEKVLYSSKITVKPRKSTEITFEDVDRYFESLKESPIMDFDFEDYHINEGGSRFLEICLPDLHIGQYSSYAETGEIYDKDIAVERVEQVIDDIIKRAQGKKFNRVVLALLGDTLACDNNNHATTKGTLQDIDGRPYEAFDAALTLLIKVVTRLLKIAPVHVINVTGNHDALSSYYLVKSLEAYFNNNCMVNFDIAPNTRKTFRLGDVLIGYNHGDMRSENLKSWLQNDYAYDWGFTKYREIHVGHLHHDKIFQQTMENSGGVTIRYLNNLGSLSAWENKQGFPISEKVVQSFVWDEDTGLNEIWYSRVEDI